MDLTTRLQYPIVRLRQEERIGGNMHVSGGMWHVPLKDLEVHADGSYTYLRTGETFSLLQELKKCCLFGPSGIFSAFSNVGLSLDVILKIGHIQRLDFADFLPIEFPQKDLVIIARPLVTAIGGDLDKGEWVFPLIQYSDQQSVNITTCGFDDCPPSFSPNTMMSFYLSFRSSDHAVQLLHKSVIELSQNKPNYAITLLYASIEAASTILSDETEGRITARLHNFANRIHPRFPDHSRILRRIKRQIGTRIMKKRGDFAHKGIDLNQTDLLPSYETALEFFWHYEKFKRIKDRCSD